MFPLTPDPKKIHAWPQDPKGLSWPVAAMRLKWNPFNHNSAEGGKMTFANVGAHCDADPAAPEAAPDGVSISQL